ncbi:Cell death protease [Rhizoclosmatium sp. JEL0117]|nr:Cell death protease [Rhizoclosmatium sp. JEL0117]
MSDQGQLIANLNSWHNQANLLYLEQPLGTGFSFNNNPDIGPFTEYQVASQFLSFINGFYAVFPNTQSWDLYITGESYAGTYIPYMATAIIYCNKTLFDGITPLPLKGIGIGNGFMDYNIQTGLPSIQNKFAYLSATNLFDSHPQDKKWVSELRDMCLSTQNASEYHALPYKCDPWSIANTWIQDSRNDFFNTSTCLDLYNIEKTIPCGDSDTFTARNGAITNYLNTLSVRQALHVDPTDPNLLADQPFHVWGQCQDTTITLNRDQSYPSSDSFIPTLITAGLKVLIFNGDRDFMINYIGVEQVLANLTWGGETGFTTPRRDWLVNAVNAGEYWYDRGLTYIRVWDAGHMVSADQPISGSAVLKELLAETPSSTVFVDSAYGWLALNGPLEKSVGFRRKRSMMDFTMRAMHFQNRKVHR